MSPFSYDELLHAYKIFGPEECSIDVTGHVRNHIYVDLLWAEQFILFYEEVDLGNDFRTLLQSSFSFPKNELLDILICSLDNTVYQDFCTGQLLMKS